MPRISALGRIAAGIGEDGVSIGWFEGRELRTREVIGHGSGQAAWLNARTVVFQTGSALFTHDESGHNVQPFDAAGALGANFLAAGGDVCQVSYNGQIWILRSGQPPQSLGVGWLGDVADDGSYVVKDSNGLIDGAVVMEPQALSGGQWSGLSGEGQKWRPIAQRGVRPVVTPTGFDIFGLRVFGDFACYLMSKGEPFGQFVVAHRYEPIGLVLADRIPQANRPDVRLVDGQWLVVTYATGEGERVDTVRGWAVQPSQLTQSLGVATAPPIVVTPPVVVPPPPSGGSVPEFSWDTVVIHNSTDAVRGFAETGSVTRISLDSGALRGWFDKLTQWPNVYPSNVPDVAAGSPIVFTTFFCLPIGDRWHAFAVAMDYHNHPGEFSNLPPRSAWERDLFYGGRGVDGWQNARQFGLFFVHGARYGETSKTEYPGSLRERTNVRIGSVDGGDWSFAAGTPPVVVTPPPVKPPDVPTGGGGPNPSNPPTIDGDFLLAIIEAVKAAIAEEMEPMRKQVASVDAQLAAGFSVDADKPYPIIGKPHFDIHPKSKAV